MRRMMRMPTLIGALVIAGAALANTHDIQLTMTAPGAVGGRIAAPGPVVLRVTIKNNGPQAVVYEDGLKVIAMKFDHTGQQYLRQVDVLKDMPLLQPGESQTRDFTDKTEGNYAVTTGTFFYKAGIKSSGYYTDSNNANHKPEVGMIIYAASQTPVKWTSRLTEADFTRAGVTLTDAQKTKLRGTSYSIESIVQITTDRLVDTMTCGSCHSGQATQSAAKYRPVNPTSFSTTENHRKGKSDMSVTSGYNWGEANKSGVIAAFIASSINKPNPLEKIFHLWMLDGKQQ